MPVSEARTRPTARCKHVLFIDGLPYAFTDDDEGILTGSGAGSWIGKHEAATGWEVVGEREVRPGLRLPDTITQRINEKTGLPEGGGLVTFELLDLDDDIVRLFATEGKHEGAHRLVQRIEPGLTNVTSVIVDPPASPPNTTDPSGRNIGIERIGPGGRRRYFHALPTRGVGFEHVGRPDVLSPVLITDEPIDFAGRLVTLYRIYHDPDHSDQSGHLPWPTWLLQHNANNLVWFGTMRDAGEVDGRMWSVRCLSEDSLLKKRIGAQQFSPEQWLRVGAGEIDLEEHERWVSVNFQIRSTHQINHPDHLGFNHVVSAVGFHGTLWDRQITGTTIEEIRESIDTIIQEAADGTDVNYTPNFPMPPLQHHHADGGTLDSWGGLSVTLNAENRFVLRKDDAGPSSSEGDTAWLQVQIALHRSVWAILGYDRDAQGPGEMWQLFESGPYESFYEVDFDPNELPAGGTYDLPGLAEGTGVPIPADATGYYRARFTTVGLDGGLKNNQGNPREYWPLALPSAIIDTTTRQKITLSGLGGEGGEDGGADVFWPPLNHVPRDPDASSGTNAARHFVLRGKYRGPHDNEDRDRYQVIRAAYNAGAVAQYGNVLDHELFVERYLEPRNWGFDDDRMKDVVWIATDENPIEIAPLVDLAYRTRIPSANGGDHVEQASHVLTTMLLSTGSGELHFGGGGTPGDNEPGGTTLDTLSADYGLGVPATLVDADSIIGAFHDVGDGLSDPLNRVRYCYLETPQAYEILRSILEPRGLAISLHGGRFGLFRMGLFSPEDADVILTEDDLFGTPGDPRSTQPTQETRVTGQIDVVELGYRVDPEGGGHAHTRREHARDTGARHRTGTLVHQLHDDGLMPPALSYQRGPGNSRLELSGTGEWESTFREIWTLGEDSLCHFYATRHFAVEVEVSRPKGQDLRPGTAVLFSNRWPASNDGTYGLQNRLGRVISVTHNLRRGSTTARILVFGGQAQGIPHFAPLARIKGIDGTTITYYSDALGHGDSSLNDGRGFARPAWWDGTGNLQCAIYIRKGTTWSLGPTCTVESVDLVNRTITTTEAVTGVLRDKDKILIARPMDDQSEGAWPNDLYAPVVSYEDIAAGKPFIA